MAFWNKRVDSGEEGSLLKSHGNGASRRAINMLPSASDGARQVARSAELRYHQLLITLEGNQRTGVVKVVSPGKLSRAGLLIYRGAVLGCIYGRKGMDGQLIGQEAHPYVLADMANPGNLIDAYEISEELALAAASLFHGEVLQIPFTGDSLANIDRAVSEIIQSRKPGCIVLSAEKSEKKDMVYLAKGEIVGVFSEHDGWLKPNLGSVLKIAEKSGEGLAVFASQLNVECLRDVERLGFALTGLRDRGTKYATDMFIEQTAADRPHPATAAPGGEQQFRRPAPENWRTLPTAPVSQRTFSLDP